jgi:hypothetical protein
VSLLRSGFVADADEHSDTVVRHIAGALLSGDEP